MRRCSSHIGAREAGTSEDGRIGCSSSWRCCDAMQARRRLVHEVCIHVGRGCKEVVGLREFFPLWFTSRALEVRSTVFNMLYYNGKRIEARGD